MDEYFFNDERYLQYCQEAIEHQPMPQYIIYLEEEALKHPGVLYVSSDEETEEEVLKNSEVIYISSDEEAEEDNIDKTTLTGNHANIRVAPRDERVTGAVRCIECKIISIICEQNWLSNLTNVCYNTHPYCLGCRRLYEFAESKREVTAIIKWLVTGEIPSDERPNMPLYRTIVNRLAVRRISMERRVIRNGCDGSALITTYELFHLCLEKQFKCAVSGHYVYFHRGSQPHIPHWALTFDHINALHYYKKNPNSWSINNIQVLSSILNSIKGSNSNEELIRWYVNFVAIKKNEL